MRERPSLKVESPIAFYNENVEMRDVLLKAGYKELKSGSNSQRSFVRVDGDGRRVRGDKCILSSDGQSCYHTATNNRYNVVDFIRQHQDSFAASRSGVRGWQLVEAVCSPLLPRQRPNEREVITYDEHMKGYTMRSFAECDKSRFYPFFRSHGISDTTLQAFGKDIFLVSGLQDNGRMLTSLSFPQTKGGSGVVTGFEMYGTEVSVSEKLTPLLGKGDGVWQSSPDRSPDGPVMPARIYWFDNGYDAMAEYQIGNDASDEQLERIERYNGDGREMSVTRLRLYGSPRANMYVSTGGVPTEKQIREIVTAFPYKEHVLCFANDALGRHSAEKFKTIATQLGVSSDDITVNSPLGYYRSWSDALQGKKDYSVMPVNDIAFDYKKYDVDNEREEIIGEYRFALGGNFMTDYQTDYRSDYQSDYRCEANADVPQVIMSAQRTDVLAGVGKSLLTQDFSTLVNKIYCDVGLGSEWSQPAYSHNAQVIDHTYDMTDGYGVDLRHSIRLDGGYNLDVVMRFDKNADDSLSFRSVEAGVTDGWGDKANTSTVKQEGHYDHNAFVTDLRETLIVNPSIILEPRDTAENIIPNKFYQDYSGVLYADDRQTKMTDRRHSLSEVLDATVMRIAREVGVAAVDTAKREEYSNQEGDSRDATRHTGFTITLDPMDEKVTMDVDIDLLPDLRYADVNRFHRYAVSSIRGMINCDDKHIPFVVGRGNGNSLRPFVEKANSVIDRYFPEVRDQQAMLSMRQQQEKSVTEERHMSFHR